MFEIDEGPIRIGVVGLGRSGWRNHALSLASLPELFHITAAVDPDPIRRKEARTSFGCRSYDGFDALLADPAIEVVTVATPSHLHLEHAEAALAAGKHVVCEKPMAGSLEEVDRMIHAAQRAERVLTVFQNRRFSPDFLRVHEVIKSGLLGRILHIRLAIHTYGRRWDWQTLRAFNGGELNNTASHFIDQALLLLGDTQPEVFCHTDRALTCGDAEDFCKITMRATGHPLVEVEVNYAAAIPQERWLVMGTRGALTGGPTKLRWRTSNVDALPQRRVETEPTTDRSYNNENYQWKECSWTLPPDEPTEPVRFYKALHATLRHGQPLAVTPQSVRRQVSVLDRCRQSAGIISAAPVVAANVGSV